MSENNEIYLEARPAGEAPGASCVPGESRASAGIRAAARNLLHLPGLQSLRPLARRAEAVSEQAGRATLQTSRAATTNEACRGIRVVSANLCHDWPRYRRQTERLEAFSQLAEEQQADVVLLQEVARTGDLRVDEWLSQRLKMNYLYSRANGANSGTRGIGFEEGLAVLSRFPISAPRLTQLSAPGNPFVRRLALGAVIESPCGDLLTCSVHLGLTPRQNARQLERLRCWVSEVAGELPALVGGDFNAGEGSAQIRGAKAAWLDTFRHLHPHAEGATHELRWPWGGLLRRARLDYIFLRPGRRAWQVLEARHLAVSGEPHSDHQAVFARLAPVLK